MRAGGIQRTTHVKRKGIVTVNYSFSCGLMGSLLMSDTNHEEAWLRRPLAAMQ